jgi:adenosylcobyric acid synthase
MLGRFISDPEGIEGPPTSVRGLGLLDVETVMSGDKTLREVGGEVVGMGAGAGRPAVAGPSQAAPLFAGYEMHVGVTTGSGCGRPFLRFADGTLDGAVSADGLVAGCYVHGLFGLTSARAALLASLGAESAGVDHSSIVDAALDEIAATLESCLNIDALAAIAGL